MTLPAFYIDNVRVISLETMMVRGNKVSDCYGVDVVGIEATNCDTLRAKDNTVVRLRSSGGTGICYKVSDCKDTLFVYNTASRATVGFDFSSIDTQLAVYNLTSHNCSIHVQTDVVVPPTFYNVCFSNYEDHKTYKQSFGVVSSNVAPSAFNYFVYFGLSQLQSGTAFVAGDAYYTDKPLYIDETNDDLTPDHISILVNTGTDNPLRTELTDIGGKESEVENETIPNRNYYYDLIDTTFWDAENEYAAETVFIKALQSRILSNAQVALTSAKHDYYIKEMDSSLGFSELFPTQTSYQSQTKFKKRVADLWYATQCPGTIQVMQNSIGGYNLHPSFFKRLEDFTDCWVIGVSYVGIDNTLLGYEGVKYGIGIDFLGYSVISKSNFEECYKNVSECVADVAPVKWFLHNEQQPEYYLLFTDRFNGWERCTLDNMIYSDDFTIVQDEIGTGLAGECITPLLPTGVAPISGIPTIGPASSGGVVELSLLDRVYSEDIERTISWREGDTQAEVNAQGWTPVSYTIGGYFTLTKVYVQFKIEVSGVLRQNDYEFIGLCLRPWSIRRTGWPPGDPWCA